MIHYDLRCAKEHVFDAWFRDSAAYDELARQRKLSCPVCGSKRVTKAPMAPRVVKSRGSEAADGPQPGSAAIAAQAGARKVAMMPQHKRVLEEMRKHVEANCDYVGQKFPEEARKIHYGEVGQRSIYGEATEEEAGALADEGIEVHSIPWPARSDA
jgi:hypothetical protein